MIDRYTRATAADRTANDARALNLWRKGVNAWPSFVAGARSRTGKVERFHRTMLDERTYQQPYQSETETTHRAR